MAWCVLPEARCVTPAGVLVCLANIHFVSDGKTSEKTADGKQTQSARSGVLCHRAGPVLPHPPRTTFHPLCAAAHESAARECCGRLTGRLGWGVILTASGSNRVIYYTVQLLASPLLLGSPCLTLTAPPRRRSGVSIFLPRTNVERKPAAFPSASCSSEHFPSIKTTP